VRPSGQVSWLPDRCSPDPSRDRSQWLRRVHSPVTVARPRRSSTGFPVREIGLDPSRFRPDPLPPVGSPRGHEPLRLSSGCYRLGKPPAGTTAPPRLCSPGIGGVRRLIGYLVLTVVAAGCQAAASPPTSPPAAQQVRIRESPSPFREVTAGDVRALIPDAWDAVPAGMADDVREGFIARPRPGAWEDGAQREGMAALWVDGTRVGVPSDYYYLAAAGSALDILTRSRNCSATRQTVVVDHAPAFTSGAADSPGDYIAHGQGTCSIGRTPTRWAYFVAAPGFGPAREVGIPKSSLYVVVAFMPDGPRTDRVLTKLVETTEFGGASMTDFIAAARTA
jgi:hypothetical protein